MERGGVGAREKVVGRGWVAMYTDTLGKGL